MRVKNSGIIKLKHIRDKDGDGDMFIAEAAKNIPFKKKGSFLLIIQKETNPFVASPPIKSLTRRFFVLMDLLF